MASLPSKPSFSQEPIRRSHWIYIEQLGSFEYLLRRWSSRDR